MLLRLGTIAALIASAAMAGSVGATVPQQLAAVKQRGYSETSAVFSNDVSSVDLQSGNLSIVIPVGQSADSSTSIGFKLVLSYNSNAWDSHIGLGTAGPDAPDGTSLAPIQTVAFNTPMGDSNVALGWKVSLGEIYPPSQEGIPGAPPFVNDGLAQVNELSERRWIYIAPDGGRHAFDQRLHPASAAGESSGTTYTQDGTYLRMRELNSRLRVIDFPDGSKRVFECPANAAQNNPLLDGCWRLVRIDDAYVNDGVPNSGSSIRLEYLNGGLLTRIIDSQGRTTSLNFRTSTGSPRYAKVLDSIDLPGPQGTRSIFSFQSHTQEIMRGCTPGVLSVYRAGTTVVPQTTSVVVLDGLILPDGSRYAFSYLLETSPTGEDSRCLRGSGRIQQLVQPSGKVTQWSYSTFGYGTEDCTSPIDGGDYPDQGGPLDPAVTFPVVSETREFLSAGDPSMLARWRYIRERTREQLADPPNDPLPPDVCKIASRQASTTVIDPRGNATVHYYTISRNYEVWGGGAHPFPLRGSTVEGIEPWNNREHLLPYTKYRWMQAPVISGAPAPQRAFLSTEFYGCDPGHDPNAHVADIGDFVPGAVFGCTRLRQSFVRMELDPAADDPVGNLLFQILEPSNPRTTDNVSVYVDDGQRYIATRSWDYDGFGNFRRSASDANFDNAETRREFTNYNAGRSTSDIPGPSSPWLLKLFDRVEVTQNQDSGTSQTARTEYCFDPTSGFLRGVRALRNFDQASRGSHDVFVQYVPKSEYALNGAPGGTAPLNAEVRFQKFFGGDVSGVSIEGCDQTAVSTAASEYALAADYSLGQLAKTSIVTPASVLPGSTGVSSLLAGPTSTIDLNSGLATDVQQPNSASTHADYDSSSRPIRLTSSGLATSEYSYCWATQPNPTGACAGNLAGKNAIVMRSYTSPNLEVGYRAVIFDNAGRKIEERERIGAGPGSSQLRKRLYRYSTAGADQGYLVEQTPWSVSPQMGANNNETFEYDVFGRMVRHRASDGTVLKLEYAGDRRMSRKVQVQVAQNQATGDPRGESLVETFYDHLRRVVEVRDYVSNDIVPGGVDRQRNTITTYFYDALGNVEYARSTCHWNCGASGVLQERFFSYNALGRLTSMKEPELAKPADVPGGAPVPQALLFSGYDSFGNLKSQALEDGTNKIFYQYDKAGRRTRSFDGDPSVTGPDAAHPLVEIWYGLANQGSDLRATAPVMMKRHNYLPVDPANPALGTQDWVVRETYRYEHPAGLLTSTTTLGTRLDGALHRSGDLQFVNRISYQPDGSVASFDYPSCNSAVCGSTLPVRTSAYAYSYRALTNVGTISPTVRNIATFAYDINGSTQAVTHYALGSGPNPSEVAAAIETVTPDPSGMPRPLRIAVARPGTASPCPNGVAQSGSDLWCSGDITYDGSGNLARIGPDQYTYDLVGRMTSARTGGVEQSATYDGYGNLKTLSTNGSSRTIPADSTTNRLAGPGYGYDTAGRMTSWQGRSIAYDRADMPSFATWTDSGTPIKRGFVYSPTGSRVALVDFSSGGSQLWTLRGIGGATVREVSRAASGTLAWSRDYVQAGTRTVATFEVDSSGAQRERHYHPDHLGSTRAVTDEASNLVARFDLHPFGEIAASSGAGASAVRKLFTGHERDKSGPSAADDLDYMGARYYSPVAGRFLSRDPLGGSVESSQSWNRYAYALNNPVRNSDPTGAVTSNCPKTNENCNTRAGGAEHDAGPRTQQPLANEVDPRIGVKRKFLTEIPLAEVSVGLMGATEKYSLSLVPPKSSQGTIEEDSRNGVTKAEGPDSIEDPLSVILETNIKASATYSIPLHSIEYFGTVGIGKAVSALWKHYADWLEDSFARDLAVADRFALGVERTREPHHSDCMQTDTCPSLLNGHR